MDEAVDEFDYSNISNINVNAIKIYPNPSQNFLIVTTNNKAIAYYADVNGQFIATLKEIGADNLLDKMNLEVGEEGANLSNGERQLVSFARAVIKNPAILIMDEATSSIDTITEAKIQAGINRIIEGRTSIIIAHRLSTIKNCDRIVVIENGSIKEIGSHDDLLKSGGHYADLYKNQ